MKYNKMHKNLFFREVLCGLTVEETAKLCFKTVRQVKFGTVVKQTYHPSAKGSCAWLRGENCTTNLIGKDFKCEVTI
ncbi:hypothetical protein DET48_1353 [Vibrio diazotrophicus]|uniref:Uncharacterized protein n=1 Tax=Vibrio diazotrophicus TaxID=685 RepID=A0A329E927_VIBDI|nr:hypothetical protein DET48_1353 [Vibrio diazotrophicus]